MPFKLLVYSVLILIHAQVRAQPDAPRPFPITGPIWNDEGDFTVFGPMPEEYTPAPFWEVFDQTLLRPQTRFLAVDPASRAANVNSMDEVPNSSWFENRIGIKKMSVTDFKRGKCADSLDPSGPLEVLSGKPDGMNPGFLVKAKNGQKYFFKFDDKLQPQRPTAADTIGSVLYHAIGFSTSCNEVVYFKPTDLILGKDATIKISGKKRPMTELDIKDALRKVSPDANGTLRANASLLIEGKPLGPWTYQGTWDADPNDVFPHEDRREIRGSKLMAAWLNHFDSRDQNTLTAWIDPDKDGKGYVRHYLIDFGDCLGSLWDWDEVSRRHGHSYYLDVGDILSDFATLGVRYRPWDRAKYGSAGSNLAYFSAENFIPEDWHNGYPLPAFGRMTEADAAWMARLMAEIRDEFLDAAVDRGRITLPIMNQEVRRILKIRRDKILRRYLSKLSALSHPEILGRELCVRDLAVFSNLVSKENRNYSAQLWVNQKPTRQSVRKGPKETICLSLPTLKTGEFLAVDIASKGFGNETGPLRVHLYSAGEKSKSLYKIVGLERLE